MCLHVLLTIQYIYMSFDGFRKENDTWFAVFIYSRHAELTIWQADKVRFKGVRVRYHSSFQKDPLVLLRARCIAPIHARLSFLERTST